MQPPPLADRILKRVLPLGKRGDSILGDLRQEFREVTQALGPARASGAGRARRRRRLVGLAATPLVGSGGKG